MISDTIQFFVFSKPEFKENYDFYECNDEIIKEINNRTFSIILKVFASITCQYCKIYIPRLLKINQKTNFSIDFVVWEDYSEDETFSLMDDFNLTGLPTIIVYHKKSTNDLLEIGRIVKEPGSTLEQDLLNILKNNSANTQN